MPRQQPIQSYLHIRDYAERWSWTDPKTNTKQVGYNPPPEATDKHRVPFTFVGIKKDGRKIAGTAVTLDVNTRRAMRRIQFTDSLEIRWISDLFIISIDGVRFYVH